MRKPGGSSTRPAFFVFWGCGSGAADETDLAHVGGCDVHVCDAGNRDHDAAALLVGQAQDARLVLQRLPNQLLDLIRRLRTRQYELPGALRDADLDLHADLRFELPLLIRRVVDAL